MTANPYSARPSEPERLGLDTLYRRLKAISGCRLAGESLDHTLQATALANEVWPMLYELSPEKATNPSQATKWFVAKAVIAVRQVLVDHARRRWSLKRGRSRSRVELDDSATDGEDGRGSGHDAILALNELLSQLAVGQPLQGRRSA